MSEKNWKEKFRDTLVLGIFLILTIWLSPFILIGAVAYLFYRLRKNQEKKQLLREIRQDWFPKGKYLFFLYSDSKKWKDYFEKELIPKISDKAVVWNWSTRYKDGWKKEGMEGRILSLFRPLGYFYPMAIVFLPDGDVKTFQFYNPYVNRLKSGKDDYRKNEKEFLELVDSIGR